MSLASQTTVVGVFNERSQADLAIDELVKAGFRNDQIGVVTRDAKDAAGVKKSGNGKTADAKAADAEAKAGTGAVAGAVAGAGIGGLVGLGVLAGVIPVIGPAIAAGTLGTILTNAAGGAGLAGLAGALTGWGVSEEHAKYYDGQLVAGRVVVTVHSDERGDEARKIMQRHGGYSRDAAVASATRL